VFGCRLDEIGSLELYCRPAISRYYWTHAYWTHAPSWRVGPPPLIHTKRWKCVLKGWILRHPYVAVGGVEARDAGLGGPGS
jgi:hypothetical protein